VLAILRLAAGRCDGAAGLRGAVTGRHPQTCRTESELENLLLQLSISVRGWREINLLVLHNIFPVNISYKEVPERLERSSEK